MKYEIVSAEDSGEWTNDLGDANVFDSVAEAEDGIEQLRKLGEDWAAGTYRVRVIGERDPL